MAAQNPPVFLQAGSHPAEDVRRFMTTISNDLTGVMLVGDLNVTEKSGTPNMSVDVASGRAFVAGTEATYQGTYFVENRGVTNLVVAASDATNPRKDLVVAKVQDAAYSGATNAWSLAVVTGTPAATPAEPTAPANSITLAMVDVAASSTSVTNANITDRRQRWQRSPFKASAYQTSAQSIADNLFVKCNWHAERWDSNGDFNLVTDEYACQRDGLFQVDANWLWAKVNTANTGSHTLAVYKNGSEYKRGLQLPWGPGNEWHSDQVNATVDAVVGDTLSIWIFQNNGASRSSGGLQVANWVDIRYLGPS